MSPDLQPVIDLVNYVGGTYHTLGLWAALAAAFYGFVKVWRLPAWEALLIRIPVIGPYLAWSTWPKWLAVVVALGLPAAAAVCTAVGAGVAPVAIVLAGLGGLATGVLSGGLDGVVNALTADSSKKAAISALAILAATDPAKVAEAKALADKFKAEGVLPEAKALSDALHAAGIKSDPRP